MARGGSGGGPGPGGSPGNGRGGRGGSGGGTGDPGSPGTSADGVGPGGNPGGNNTEGQQTSGVADNSSDAQGEATARGQAEQAAKAAAAQEVGYFEGMLQSVENFFGQDFGAGLPSLDDTNERGDGGRENFYKGVYYPNGVPKWVLDGLPYDPANPPPAVEPEPDAEPYVPIPYVPIDVEVPTDYPSISGSNTPDTALGLGSLAPNLAPSQQQTLINQLLQQGMDPSSVFAQGSLAPSGNMFERPDAQRGIGSLNRML